MNFKRIYIDVNIFFEILEERKNYEFAKSIFERKGCEFCVSILTVHLIYYFAKKMSIKTEFFQELLDLCTVLQAGQKEFLLAKVFYTENQDMEDAIHIAIAHSYRIERFATLDKDLIKKFSGKVGFDFITA